MRQVHIDPSACLFSFRMFQWMPNYKGLANGIVGAGFGAAPLIFNQVQTRYINPDNLSPVGPPTEDCGESEQYVTLNSLPFLSLGYKTRTHFALCSRREGVPSYACCFKFH